MEHHGKVPWGTITFRAMPLWDPMGSSMGFHGNLHGTPSHTLRAVPWDNMWRFMPCKWAGPTGEPAAGTEIDNDSGRLQVGGRRSYGGWEMGEAVGPVPRSVELRGPGK